MFKIYISLKGKQTDKPLTRLNTGKQKTNQYQE